MHFVTFEAFLKMGCGAEMKGTRVAFASNSGTDQYCYLKLRNSSVLGGLLPYLPTIPLILWIPRRKRERHVVCCELKTTARSRKISTPTKCSRSKFASRFKLKPRPKSLISALEHQLKYTSAARPILWRSRCCCGARTVVPSLQFSPTRKQGGVRLDNQVQQAKNLALNYYPMTRQSIAT